jgi:hypothetical protein
MYKNLEIKKLDFKKMLFGQMFQITKKNSKNFTIMPNYQKFFLYIYIYTSCASHKEEQLHPYSAFSQTTIFISPHIQD